MKKYVVLSIIHCITEQEFGMNADRIVIRPVPYISQFWAAPLDV